MTRITATIHNFLPVRIFRSFSSNLFNYRFPNCIYLDTWYTQQVIVAQHMCWFLKAYTTRNGIIAHWIVRLIPHSRVCPPITELSRQKCNWAYERLWPEPRLLYTMTGPCLIKLLLEINMRSLWETNWMRYRRQKHILPMTNMRISSTPT